jgi:hypothetical protein
MLTAMIASGIVATLSVSSAALSYTWKTVRDYRLEREAVAACRVRLSDDLRDAENTAEAWSILRGCVNHSLLGVPDFHTFEISEALEHIASAIVYK